MKSRFFAYNQDPKKGKYTEITEEEYLTAKATGKRYFICLDGAFLECEEQEYVSYFKEKNHSDYTQKNEKGHHVVPLSYDELSTRCGFERRIVTDPTLPTTEQEIEERLCSEWELQTLHKALAKLKPDEAELIHRIYWDNMSQVELAEEYHVSQQMLNKKVRRILCKLMKFMKK